jgi:hypothetical protein
LRKPVVACSSVIPSGSIALKRASCCGFFEIFVDTAFGGATGVVDAVVVVVVEPEVEPDVEPPVVEPPVDVDAVTVVLFELPVPAFPLLPAPAPLPWPLPVVVFAACVPLDGALGPWAGAEPCVLPPPALPCDTVVVGAFGAFAPPAPAPLPCAAAPVTPTDAIVSAAANV